MYNVILYTISLLGHGPKHINHEFEFNTTKDILADATGMFDTKKCTVIILIHVYGVVLKIITMYAKLTIYG